MPLKQLRLLPRLLVVFHKLMVRPHCLKQYLHISLNMEKPQWCLSGGFTLPVHGTGRYSASYQRRKVMTNPSTNPAIHNGDVLCMMHLYDSGTNMGVTILYLVGCKAHSTKWSPCPGQNGNPM